MAFTCFVSHNANEDERVFVYRLQTLATSSGINVLLPHRVGRHLSDETRRRIESADLILVFLTSPGSSQVQQELAYAIGAKKPVAAIYRQGARPRELSGIHWIKYDPMEGFGSVENEVLGLLRDRLSQKQTQQAALLAVLGLGLLALLAQQPAKR